jgi:hypothetical protein
MRIIYFLFICFFSISIYSQQINNTHKIPTTLSEVYNDAINLDFSQSSGFLNGIWTGRTNMPYPRYYGASIAYTKNDTTWLYIFGGDTTGIGNATNVCLRYNTSVDSWEYIDTLPIPMRVNSAARLGDKLYTMGGFSGNNPDSALKKFFEYDIAADNWTELPDLPEGIFYHKSFGYQDSLIYILGGIKFDSTRYLDRVLLFNTTTRQFRDATPLPEPGANFSLTILNDTIYISGGLFSNDSLSGKTIVASINPFNHSSITYSVYSDSASSYPVPVHSHFGYPNGGNKINFFGGSISTGLSPVNNSFTLRIPEIEYFADSISNAPFSATAFHAGYAYTFVNPGSDSILNVIVAGGVTPGSAISSQTWVYSDTITITGIKEIKNISPSGYKLFQNYPNPFNPSTTMNFSIPEYSFVTLEIFNLLGEKIVTLVSQDLSKGTYEYKWNAEGMTSGTYFYRLTAGEYSEVRKLLLLK